MEKRVLLISSTKIPVYKVLVYKNQKGPCASLASQRPYLVKPY